MRRMPLLGLLAALVAVGTLAARAQEQVDPRIAAYDKGPATIDVSKYPPEMRTAYKTFSSKCSKCHTLARAINCDFALDEEWERYVKRMMRKPGSDISSAEGKQIFEFLAYDSKARKKALYDKKLKDAGKP